MSVDDILALSTPLVQRYCLMRYVLGEPHMDALAVAAHLQDTPLDRHEAEYIAANWNREPS